MMSLNCDLHGMKLKVLCERLAVDYDEARYTLARGVLPKGIEDEPGRGNHRVFNYSQAFSLAVVLKLKAAGIATPLAAKISEWSRDVQHMSVGRSWDPQFAPFAGKLKAQCQWLMDVGDARFVRLVTDANPSSEGEMDVLDWVDMTTRRRCKQAQTAVIFRVDLALIAQQLLGTDPPRETPSLLKCRRRRSRRSR